MQALAWAGIRWVGGQGTATAVPTAPEAIVKVLWRHSKCLGLTALPNPGPRGAQQSLHPHRGCSDAFASPQAPLLTLLDRLPARRARLHGTSIHRDTSEAVWPLYVAEVRGVVVAAAPVSLPRDRPLPTTARPSVGPSWEVGDGIQFVCTHSSFQADYMYVCDYLSTTYKGLHAGDEVHMPTSGRYLSR